jgi:hypothetical protein
MTPAEAAIVLARAAIFDKRTVGEIEAHAWAKALGGIPLPDAVEAVDQHYAATRDWLMPSDVRHGVRRIRQLRLDRAGDPVPDADPDDTEAYRLALREGRTRIADGLVPRPVAELIAANPLKSP